MAHENGLAVRSRAASNALWTLPAAVLGQGNWPCRHLVMLLRCPVSLV